MMLEKIQRENLKKDLPEFRPGDTVRVYNKVLEGDKARTQVFEGVVLRRKGHGIESTFSVRKISYGIGVERIFPLHSPSVEKIEVASHGKVRRSRLYYLRELTGKKARIEEKEEAKGKAPEASKGSASV